MQPDPRAKLAQGRGEIVEASAALDVPPTLRGVLQIHPIGARVLGNDQDFLDAGAHQLLGLAQYLADRTADEVAAHRGNDAEAAAMIAAFGDLQIGVMARRQLHALRRYEVEERLMLRRQMLVHRGDHLFVALRTGDLEHLRMPVENLLRLCSQAARDDHFAVLGQRFADRIERFIDRGIDEAAGIDDNQVGRAVARGHLVALPRASG